MRVDKVKNIEKVIKERLENPLQTTREIANKIWIDHWTVARLDKELPQIATKDDRIITITEKDFEILEIIQKEKKNRLLNETEKINNSDIDKWEQTATRRYMLFKWDITNPNWWLKDLDLEKINLAINENI